jgi:hypothetical protein
MTTITLPPLPELVVIDTHIPTNIVIRGYTSKQMREYGKACATAERERCAKVCRDFDATDSLSNYGLVLARMIDDLEIKPC